MNHHTELDNVRLELETKSVEELKRIARFDGIKGITKMSKQILINAILSGDIYENPKYHEVKSGPPREQLGKQRKVSWANVYWTISQNPIQKGVKLNESLNSKIKLRPNDTMILTIPVTRDYAVTREIKVHPRPTDGVLKLGKLLSIIYRYYQKPIGKDLSIYKTENEDIFEYLRTATPSTKRIYLLGDMRFFEGIKFEKREKSKVYYRLELGS